MNIAEVGSNAQKNSRITAGGIKMKVAHEALGNFLNIHMDEFESRTGSSQYQYTLEGFVYRHPSQIGTLVSHPCLVQYSPLGWPVFRLSFILLIFVSATSLCLPLSSLCQLQHEQTEELQSKRIIATNARGPSLFMDVLLFR